MNRTPGHALQRTREDGTPKSRWNCECGLTFGQLGVHAARAKWNEHKDALPAEPEQVPA